MEVKKIFVYGLLLAALVVLLKFMEYNYLVRSLSQEAYIGLIAFVFTGLGIWTGLRWVNRKLQQSVPVKTSQELQRELGISQREMEVLVGMTEGLSNKEIAEKLFLSESTIKTHSSNLFSKLNANRRTKAIHQARLVGLITPNS